MESKDCLAEQSSERSVVDYARGKIALEHCNHPEYMTMAGDENDYGTNIPEYGYLGIHHPSNITLDLDSEVLVRQISIKFMDPNDTKNKNPNKEQCYAFRLLCSNDMLQWQILYDSTATDKPYRIGWFHLRLEENVTMRFFRVHALHNPANSGFHIVRLRLFNIENKSVPDGEKIESLVPNECEYEINDTTPLATKLLNIAERLYRGSVDENGNSPDDFKEVYNYVVERAFELQAVDGKVDQVRKIITPLISEKMEKKQSDSIKSTKWQWFMSCFFIVAYVVVSIICSIKAK